MEKSKIVQLAFQTSQQSPGFSMANNGNLDHRGLMRFYNEIITGKHVSSNEEDSEQEEKSDFS